MIATRNAAGSRTSRSRRPSAPTDRRLPQSHRDAGAFSRIVTPAAAISAIWTVIVRGTSVMSVATAPVACSMFQSSWVMLRS
jgi:hypothetical protein